MVIYENHTINRHIWRILGSCQLMVSYSYMFPIIDLNLREDTSCREKRR